MLLAAVEMFGQLSPPPDIQTSNSIAESKHPTFELATIKPTFSGIGGFLTYPGGRMKCGVCTIDMLVRLAFDVQPYQIVGAPGWAHSERYSIDAIPPESSELRDLKISSPTNALTDEQRQMLQSLLIDRFQLKFHRDIQTGLVYSLTRGSGSLRLLPPQHPDYQPWAGSNAGGAFNGDGIAGSNISMPLLAKRLSVILQRPVLDETGVSGSFDFKYEYANFDPNADSQDVIRSILTSVEAIGLKLKSTKGKFESIVIDHIERPSPN